MAEKIDLIDLDIDTDKVIAAMDAIEQRMSNVKDRQKELKESGQENSKEYIVNAAELKNLQGQLRSAETVMGKLAVANNETAGTLPKLEAENAKLRLIQKGLNLETEQGIKDNEAINKKIDANTEAIKKNIDTTSKGRMEVGQYSKGIQDAAGKLQGMGGAVGGAITGVKNFGAATSLAMGPIGLIAVAINGLVAAFKMFGSSSEDGQNKMAKFGAIIKTIFGNIGDIISKIGKTIADALSQPKVILQGFLDFLKDQVMNRIKSLGVVFSGLRKILTGDIKEGLKEVGNGYLQAITGVENFADKSVKAYNKIKQGIKGVIDESNKEIDIATKLADIKAKLDKEERTNLVLNAEARLKLAKIKNDIDDKDKNSAQERLRLLDEQNKIYDEIEARELKTIKTKYELKKAQNELSNSTKEDLMEEAQLQADLLNKEAEITEKRKEGIAKRFEAINAIRNEEKAAAAEKVKQEKELADKALKAFENEMKLYKLKNETLIKDGKLLTKELVNQEIERLETIYQKEVEYAEKTITDATELQIRKLELQKQFDAEKESLKTELDEQNKALEFERLQANYDNEMQLLNDNLVAQLDLEKSQLKARQAQELEIAKKTGADVALINEKYAKIEIDIERAKMAAKLDVLASFAGNVANAFGESTKLGKIAASAQTAINTYQGAMAAFSAAQIIPPPFGQIIGIASSAAVTIAGAKAIKDIWAVKADIPGASSGGGGGAMSIAPISSGSVPSESKINAAIKATETPNNVEAVRASINPEIGQGIVSRGQSNTANQIAMGVEKGMQNVTLQPTLLQSDVEAKGTQSELNKQTQIL